MIEVTIGDLLRRRRRARGLNQSDVGAIFSVNQSTVAKWERGTRPSPDQLPALAEFLDLPLSEVLALYHGGEGDAFEAALDDIRATLHAHGLQLNAIIELVSSVATQLDDVVRPRAAPAPRRRRAAVQGAG